MGDTVMFVPATPGGKLAQMWRQVVEKNNGPVDIKIEERGGKSMKSVFQRSNPSKTIGCDEVDCLPCMEGKGMCGDCRKTGIGYRVECCECEMNVHYEGETSKSGYVRGLKHLSNYKAKTHDSPLWKHAAAGHNGRMDVKYKMRVLQSFRDPLTRQVNEAVRIQQSNADILLNSKSEWFGPATVRLVAEGGGWS